MVNAGARAFKKVWSGVPGRSTPRRTDLFVKPKTFRHFV
jgi:hypothetical protein